MVYVSLSARIRLDVEALNMSESIGNYVRRRRAPVIVEAEDGYRIEYVPAISGESLAHAYQVNLAKLADELGLPVCEWCRKGVLVKHADDKYFHGIKPAEKKPEEIEEHVVKNCVVEDVGGFLYPKKTVKRTSRITFGYMVPIREALRAVAVEPEFHVRYEPEAKEMQAIYNVEVATAIYGLKAELDVDGIGKSALGEAKYIVGKEERIKRIEAAIKALTVTLGNMGFGAKKARFFPADWEMLNAVAVISHPIPFTASSPRLENYVEQTLHRAQSMLKHLSKGSTSILQNISIGIMGVKPTVEPQKIKVEILENFEELMTWVLTEIKNKGTVE